MKTLVLTVAIASFLGALTPADAEGKPLLIDIGLADGSRVLGIASDAELLLTTAFGRFPYRLSSGDRLDANDDRETVTLRTTHGDIVRGVLESPFVTVRPFGSAERRQVPCGDIRSLSTMDPIEVAGSEGAEWEVEYEHARGWTSKTSEGCLTVTGIEADKVHSGGGGPWSTVRLIRRVENIDNFELEADISWADLSAGKRAMQNLFISLVDEYGNVIAAVGHHDAWSGETGSRYSLLPGVNRTKGSGWGSEPLVGSAKLRIIRIGETVTIFWDGAPLHSGSSAAPVCGIEVQFDFYDYRVGDHKSEFGSETLHRLEWRKFGEMPPVASVESEDGCFHLDLTRVETAPASDDPARAALTFFAMLRRDDPDLFLAHGDPVSKVVTPDGIDRTPKYHSLFGLGSRPGGIGVHSLDLGPAPDRLALLEISVVLLRLRPEPVEIVVPADSQVDRILAPFDMRLVSEPESFSIGIGMTDKSLEGYSDGLPVHPARSFYGAMRVVDANGRELQLGSGAGTGGWEVLFYRPVDGEPIAYPVKVLIRDPRPLEAIPAVFRFVDVPLPALPSR